MFEKIFFLGTGRVARDCLNILKAKFPNVVCLNVEQDLFPIVQKTCSRLNIEYKHFSKTELKNFLLSQNDKTLLISAGNIYIFPRDVVEKNNLTIINFHNAYLPYYRGRNAPTWEIYNDEKFGGATWHIVDSGIDTGKILMQEKISIEKDETAISLLTRTALLGIELLKKLLDDIPKLMRHSLRGGGGNNSNSGKIVSFNRIA